MLYGVRVIDKYIQGYIYSVARYQYLLRAFYEYVRAYHTNEEQQAFSRKKVTENGTSRVSLMYKYNVLYTTYSKVKQRTCTVRRF